ncbi:MAG: MFS transporter [Deltaproteobacteria bacterium]|jgi:predicted MFS family arabinose efflux permease|nr:MFS transporter [Deltaproteobacteria bacterium]
MSSATPRTTRPAAPPRQPSARPPLWTLTFLTFILINFCIFLGFDMLLPTLSLYLDSRGCSKEEIGLIFAVFAVASVTSRLMASRLSRRLGPLRVLRCGMVFCFVGSLTFFLIPRQFFYALARVLHGAGVGMTLTLIVSMAAQVLPPQRLGEGLGYLGLGATTALAVGPLLGLWVAGAFGYKVMFTAVALCSVAAALISLTLPPIRLASDLAPPPKGLRDLVEFKAMGPSSLIFLFAVGTCSVASYLAIYCRELGLGNAARFFVVSTAGVVLSRLSTGRIYDRYGHGKVVYPSVFLLLVSILSLVFLPDPEIMTAAAVVYGLGVGSMFPALQALTLSSAPPERRTAASALFLICFDIGIALGSLGMGFLAGRYATYSVVFLVSGVFLILLALVHLFLFGRKPGSGRPGPARSDADRTEAGPPGAAGRDSAGPDPSSSPSPRPRPGGA